MKCEIKKKLNKKKIELLEGKIEYIYIYTHTHTKKIESSQPESTLQTRNPVHEIKITSYKTRKKHVKPNFQLT